MEEQNYWENSLQTRIPVSSYPIPEENGKPDIVRLVEQPEWKTILIELVKTEKMDIWDLDIAMLADKFLKKINELQGTNLRLPANAILACAILLRFKARVLRLSSIDDDDEEEFIRKKEHETQLIEEFLPDLRAIRKMREGKITLDELVNAVEKILETSRKKKHMGDGLIENPRFVLPFYTINIDRKMEEVMAAVRKNIDGTGLVLFSAIVKGKNVYETVDYFIPLLHLSNAEKINVWQEAFFGEIFISLNDEKKKATAASEEKNAAAEKIQLGTISQ